MDSPLIDRNINNNWKLIKKPTHNRLYIMLTIRWLEGFRHFEAPLNFKFGYLQIGEVSVIGTQMHNQLLSLISNSK